MAHKISPERFEEHDGELGLWKIPATLRGRGDSAGHGRGRVFETSLVMYRHAHLKKSRAFVNVIVDIRFESINACTEQKAVARIPLSSA